MSAATTLEQTGDKRPYPIRVTISFEDSLKLTGQEVPE